MTDVSEIEQRILSEMEELRFDNIFSIINTVIDPTGYTVEIAEFADALRHLISQNFIDVRIEGFSPRDPELLTPHKLQELLTSFSDWFRFDSRRSLWTLKVGDLKTTRIPVIVVTPKGLLEARRLLAAQGYQWWRQK